MTESAKLHVPKERKRFDSPIKVYKLPSSHAFEHRRYSTVSESEGFYRRKVPGNKKDLGNPRTRREDDPALVSKTRPRSRIDDRDCHQLSFVRAIAGDYANASRQQHVSRRRERGSNLHH